MIIKPMDAISKSTDAALTYDLSLLEKSDAAWNASPGLRAVYRSIFSEMRDAAVGTRWLELGSGAGFFKRCFPNVTSSDVQQTKYVERAVSAYYIEATEMRWDTIFAMDMLHHLTNPFLFFQSASNALEVGGRIVLVEPASTAWGRVFYNLFHHEPCDPKLITNPFEFEADSDGEFANMGMGQALFKLCKNETLSKLIQYNLSLEKLKYRDLLAYPATGGLSKRQLAPTRLIQLLLKAESFLPQIILQRVGLRMIIVIQKDRP